MKNINLELKDLFDKFKNGMEINLSPKKLLSTKSGFIKITKYKLIISQGLFGLKNEFFVEWEDLEEFGVNTIYNTGILSFFVKYRYSQMVGWNLNKNKIKKSHKIASGIGKFAQHLGQDDSKFMHGGLYDHYGFPPHDFVMFLNSCLEVYRSNIDRVSPHGFTEFA